MSDTPTKQTGRSVLRLVERWCAFRRSVTASHLLACAILLTSPSTRTARAEEPRMQEVVQVHATCPTHQYRKAPVPDLVKQLVVGRKQYQLVIGASEFQSSQQDNRSFVKATAELINTRLTQRGYRELPSLSGKGPLTGAAATKARVWDALVEMSQQVDATGVGLIYYVGHGAVTFSQRDLTLSVYDRPVARDEGIRVSDVIALLSLRRYPSAVQEIPKFIVVLETCYAGNVAVQGEVAVAERAGVKLLAEVNHGMAPQPPKQMVLLTATGAGDHTRAYKLRDTDVSAFGYFFTRALSEDWACADTNPDGILTVTELEGYLARSLAAAQAAGLIEDVMRPVARDEQRFSFIAYDEDRVLIDGERSRVLELTIDVAAMQTATLTFPNGVSQVCSGTCSVVVSRELSGQLQVENKGIQDDFNPPVFRGMFGKTMPKDNVTAVDFSALLKARSATINDAVRITVK
jgi:hypothetical protein